MVFISDDEDFDGGESVVLPVDIRILYACCLGKRA